MTPLEDATRQFRVYFLLMALKRANGNLQRAARMIGIHRNSATRIMRQAGYDIRKLRTEAREMQP